MSEAARASVVPVPSVRIDEVPLGDARVEAFVRFPWDLYRGDPHWVPPLEADLLGNRLLGIKGLLQPDHPYHRTAEVTHFLAYRGERVVGRVSGAINHRFNEYYGGNYAFFGFFEVEEDYEAAAALLDAVKAWATEKGADVLRGPGEYSNVTHERQACLIDGFDQDVYVEHTYNPPYYAEFIERYGFEKSMDYHAYLLDVSTPPNARLTRVAEGVRRRGQLTTRPVRIEDLESEVRLIVDIYNQAWAQNWGFLPIQDWEAEVLVEMLKPIIDPGLIRFAYLEDQPIAVLGCFPDPNYWLQPRWKWFGDSDYVRLSRLFSHRRHIPRVRLIFFGIVPGYRRMGADALLFEEIQRYAQSKEYQTCDISLLLETNDLVIRAAEFMGAKRYKTWRIWDLPLSGS